MDVKFSDYRFCCDEHILYKNEEIIPLKSYQALLLEFFITHPDKIHSKDAIMDNVWRDKVVSEQVVFQTISQLRAILGAEAIKTFSRKGYKWELAICQAAPIKQASPVNQAVPVSESPHVSQTPPEASPTKRHLQSKVNLRWLLATIILLLLISTFAIQDVNEVDKVSLHFIQSSNSQDSLITAQDEFTSQFKQAVSLNTPFELAVLANQNSARQLFSAPTLALKDTNIAKQDWVIWTETFGAKDGVFLQYGLSNGRVNWQGYIYAEKSSELSKLLAARLSRLHILGVFDPTLKELDLSALIAMREIAPNDPDLLLQLANYYLDKKQYEVAVTYVQKLTMIDSSYGFTPYQARAKWLMAELSKKRRDYASANAYLDEMSAVLDNTPLWALIHENNSAKAWLAYYQHDFESMFSILEKGLKFELAKGSALSLFEFHIMYSILAKKGGDDHKKYKHLNDAQALLLKHNLDESNLAVVFYHFALFTQDNEKALPYLEKIVTLPKTIRNGWIIDHALEMLIDQYIEQGDFDIALSFLTEDVDSANYMLSSARIYLAKQGLDRANYFAEKALELAHLQGNTQVAMESVFILYRLTSEQPDIQAEYMAYLKRNANEKWLKERLSSITSTMTSE